MAFLQAGKIVSAVWPPKPSRSQDGLQGLLSCPGYRHPLPIRHLLCLVSTFCRPGKQFNFPRRKYNPGQTKRLMRRYGFVIRVSKNIRGCSRLRLTLTYCLVNNKLREFKMGLVNPIFSDLSWLGTNNVPPIPLSYSWVFWIVPNTSSTRQQ